LLAHVLMSAGDMIVAAGAPAVRVPPDMILKYLDSAEGAGCVDD
jgi:hypothetical protein